MSFANDRQSFLEVMEFILMCCEVWSQLTLEVVAKNSLLGLVKILCKWSYLTPGQLMFMLAML